MENRELVLTYVGMDGWDRPVYRDLDGKLWKDVSPIKNMGSNLCTSVGNEYDGEPDDVMCCMEQYRGVKVKFVPERITW